PPRPRRSGRSPRRSPGQALGLSRRRFLGTSLAAFAGATFASCARNRVHNLSTRSGGDKDKLYIYTWTGYTDDELTNRFTEQTGIEVVVDIYDSNETMLAILQAGGGDTYSIIYPSDYMVQQMIELNLLAQLDHSRIPRLNELFPNYQNPVYDPNNTHSIPISWGTTGIAYNSRVLDTVPTDWSYLWENQAQLNRRITLLDDMRETLGAALKSLGYSYNSTDPAQLEEAYQILVELKPAIASFSSSAWREQLLAGDLTLAMAYSVDAGEVVEENEDIQYIVPESGSSLWTDTLVIPASAPNPDAAYAWINLMLEPDVAAAMMERLFFATPSRTAYGLLDEEFKADTTLFPSEEILSKCEGIAPVEAETEELFDRYWTQLTSG
ncbi:MAG: ABC transporter substrate-binding protein, partial [Prochlorothrix sp.]